MNQHWASFLDDVPWFLDPGETAHPGDTEPPGAWAPQSPAFARLFPQFTAALSKAHVTPVSSTRGDFLLFGWPRGSGLLHAWLSPRPGVSDPDALHPEHRILLTAFGGIVERANEGEWWLLNHEDALTEREARNDGTFIREYADLFGKGAHGIPIDLKQFYSIAREANGNTTLCHRVTGEVVLFAPDHDFSHVEIYPGCPPYTLYRLPDAPHFSAWVETVAGQWLAMIGEPG
jgi:hypothetical protein